MPDTTATSVVPAAAATPAAPSSASAVVVSAADHIEGIAKGAALAAAHTARLSIRQDISNHPMTAVLLGALGGFIAALLVGAVFISHLHG